MFNLVNLYFGEFLFQSTVHNMSAGQFDKSSRITIPVELLVDKKLKFQKIINPLKTEVYIGHYMLNFVFYFIYTIETIYS